MVWLQSTGGGSKLSIPEHFFPLPSNGIQNICRTFLLFFVRRICLCYEYNSSLSSSLHSLLGSILGPYGSSPSQVHDKSNRIWSTIKVFQSLVCPLLSRIKVEGVLPWLFYAYCTKWILHAVTFPIRECGGASVVAGLCLPGSKWVSTDEMKLGKVYCELIQSWINFGSSQHNLIFSSW